MRPGHFEALAPVCPRCLHHRQTESLLQLDRVEAERDGHVIHGILHCSDRDCWLEFPIVDGVPLLVADPRDYLARMGEQVLERQDLPPALAGLVGDCLGPGAGYDTRRYHLSLYCGDHYRDWSGERGTSQVAATFARGLATAGMRGEGPALDLGCAVGRGAWELAAQGHRMVLGADLNFSMLRFAQRLLVEGSADFPRRRVGIVYDPVTVSVPQGIDGAALDFWAMDAAALPFPAGRFRTVVALNLIDCVSDPSRTVTEVARMLAPDGRAALATPYDWSAAATVVDGWFGGHSQRGDAAGASEPALRRALDAAGLEVTAEADGLPWRLTLHARAEMTYRMHLLALRRR